MHYFLDLKEEYELTYTKALELTGGKAPENLEECKKRIIELRSGIKRLGNVNVDAIEELELGGIDNAKSVKVLTPNGEFEDCKFTIDNDGLVVDTVVYPLLPVILKIK